MSNLQIHLNKQAGSGKQHENVELESVTHSHHQKCLFSQEGLSPISQYVSGVSIGRLSSIGAECLNESCAFDDGIGTPEYVMRKIM